MQHKTKSPWLWAAISLLTLFPSCSAADKKAPRRVCWDDKVSPKAGACWQLHLHPEAKAGIRWNTVVTKSMQRINAAAQYAELPPHYRPTHRLGSTFYTKHYCRFTEKTQGGTLVALSDGNLALEWTDPATKMASYNYLERQECLVLPTKSLEMIDLSSMTFSYRDQGSIYDTVNALLRSIKMVMLATPEDIYSCTIEGTTYTLSIDTDGLVKVREQGWFSEGRVEYLALHLFVHYDKPCSFFAKKECCCGLALKTDITEVVLGCMYAGSTADGATSGSQHSDSQSSH